MREIIKSNSFILGNFVGVIIAFIRYFVANLFFDEEDCFYCNKESGFPFVSQRIEDFGQYNEIIWVGLIGNTMILILFCFGIGLLFYFINSRRYSEIDEYYEY